MERSQKLMWMFLDIIWDEDVISEGVFFKWEAKPRVIRKIMRRFLSLLFLYSVTFD